MGMYDEVTATCPGCKTGVVFQSKAGVCLLKNYSSEAVPLAIADDLNGDVESCPGCKRVVKLMIPSEAPKRIRMVATLGTGEEWD